MNDKLKTFEVADTNSDWVEMRGTSAAEVAFVFGIRTEAEMELIFVKGDDEDGTVYSFDRVEDGWHMKLNPRMMEIWNGPNQV